MGHVTQTKKKKKRIKKPKAQRTQKKDANIQKRQFLFPERKKLLQYSNLSATPRLQRVYGTHMMALKLILSAVSCFLTNCTCKYSTKWSSKPQTLHTVWQQVACLCHIQVVPDLNLSPSDQLPWPRSWFLYILESNPH